MKKIVLTLLTNILVLLSIQAQTACTFSLTSAAGTDNQKVCKNAAITNIRYSTNGTNDTVIGLPQGLTYTYPSGSVLKISGTPTVEGVFNYTVIGKGGCSPNATITGTIMVGGGFITNNSLQKACPGVSLNQIQFYSVGGGTPSITGLPSGVNSSAATPPNTTNINGYSYALGSYNYTVTTTGSCGTQSSFLGAVIIKNMDVSILTTNTSDSNSCDGYLEVVANGQAPYTYQWGNYETTASLNNVCLGNYYVTVWDAAGCSSSANTSIGVESNVSTLKLKVNSNSVSNDSLCDGVAYVKLSGGVSPYFITFAGNTVCKVADTIYNLCPGFYTVNAYDSQMNMASFTFVVGSPSTVFNDIDSITLANTVFVDTLITSAISNCLINLPKIDSIKIASFTLNSNNTIDVIWRLYDNNTYISMLVNYPCSGTPGKYTLIIDLFCTNRESGSVRGVDEVEIEGRTAPPPTTSIASLDINTLEIYPNPFNNQIKIKVNEASTVKITDANGRVLIMTGVNRGETTFETTSFVMGMYFITITNTQGSITKKLLKN